MERGRWRWRRARKFGKFGAKEDAKITLLSAGPRADPRSPLLIYFSNVELEEETHVSTIANKFKTAFLETETEIMLEENDHIPKNKKDNDGYWLTFSDLKVDGYYDKSGIRYHKNRDAFSTSNMVDTLQYDSTQTYTTSAENIAIVKKENAFLRFGFK